MTSPPRRPSTSRAVARWAWPPDKWERLATVASLVPASCPRVLDVGGRGGELAVLLPGAEVTSANVEEPCDVLVAPGPLPFADDSFDAVTSTDVLEHVPAGQRETFVTELVRVARRRVVLCFPCGSPAKDRAEAELARRIETECGVRLDFLDEHLALGLPRPRDVDEALAAAVPGASRTWSYAGEVGEGDRVLLAAMRARHRGDPRGLPRVLRAWTVRRPPQLSPHQGPRSDRAYLVVDLPG